METETETEQRRVESLETRNADGWGTTLVCVTCRYDLSSPSSPTYSKYMATRLSTDSALQSTPENPAPFFSMRSKAAKEEDNKTAERWQTPKHSILRILYWESTPAPKAQVRLTTKFKV
jgi:hypothetical protein